MNKPVLRCSYPYCPQYYGGCHTGCHKRKSPAPFHWGWPNYTAADAAVKAEALQIIAEIHAGSRNPFEPLLARLNRKYQDDTQFDADRERDEQGKPRGEPLWP
jgi:hypothetical protein